MGLQASEIKRHLLICVCDAGINKRCLATLICPVPVTLHRFFPSLLGIVENTGGLYLFLHSILKHIHFSYKRHTIPLNLSLSEKRW